MKPVVRCTLNTPAEFLAFWKANGPFNHALMAFGETDDVLQLNECLFSNSLTALVKAYFEWDRRGITMEWEPPSEEEVKQGFHGSWYPRNFPDYLEYLGWSEPAEEAGPAEAERLFIIDLVDMFCDGFPIYEDFRFAREPFVGYLKDWQAELGGPPLDFDAMAWPAEPDTAPRDGAPWGLCPRCEAPRIREPANRGGSGYRSWEKGFLNPVYWGWKIRCPHDIHTQSVVWDEGGPQPTQEEINAIARRYYPEAFDSH